MMTLSVPKSTIISDENFAKAVLTYYEEHATETEGVPRKELFKNLSNEIVGTDRDKFFYRVTKLARAGLFPGFISKSRIGTVRISEKDRKQVMP